MGERLGFLNPIVPQIASAEQAVHHLKKPDILPNISVKEVAKYAAAATLILVGSALILDGSINHNNLETIAGAVMVIGGVIVLTR